MDEARQVLAATASKNRPFQSLSFDLSKHIGNSDHSRGNEDRHHPSPAFGLPKHAREQGQVSGKIEILRWHSVDEVVRDRGSGRGEWKLSNYR